MDTTERLSHHLGKRRLNTEKRSNFTALMGVESFPMAAEEKDLSSRGPWWVPAKFDDTSL